MFSIIIINYNTAELTCSCLESIFNFCSATELEIILVDNNSKIEDLNIIKNKFGSKITIISNNKNLGFAKANNQGAKVAKGEFIFFLNSDTLVSSDVLAQSKNVFNLQPEIGIIAPRLILKNKEEQPYSYGLDKKSGAISWVSGAALIIRKNLFEKIGEWDERFFMYFEDVDLCRRVINGGSIIERLTSNEITHLVGGSPVPYYRRKLFYYRSKILFIFKHYLKII